MSVRLETSGELENRMGLGNFIVQTLPSRDGATVIVRWDRAMLEFDF